MYRFNLAGDLIEIFEDRTVTAQEAVSLTASMVDTAMGMATYVAFMGLIGMIISGVVGLRKAQANE